MPSIRYHLNMFLSRDIRLENPPLSSYVEKLERGESFSFSRFGDGEWNAILGRPGENCDGHEFFPELGQRLRETLINPLPYIYALQQLAIGQDGIAIARFCHKNRIVRTWPNADVFHHASEEGRLLPLVSQLRKMDVVIVGPQHLRKISQRVFKYIHFIEIPSRNCFLSAEKIKSDILAVAQNNSKVVYALSASMTANVLIHDLFPVLGSDNWMIDFGSVWDVYVGAPSRGYQRGTGWDRIIRLNLGE
ncbi:hypothetical protein LDC_1463 [sediment metagenome]|uniref:Glycosyltransferase GT-D fold domain-containing protein n=1 Tax=sediment metagenome TaxID=749907 RepID=D9PIV5_9ZZZZ